MVIVAGDAGVTCFAMLTPSGFRELTSSTFIIGGKNDIVVGKQIDMIQIVLLRNNPRIRSRKHEQRQIRRRNHHKHNPPSIISLVFCMCTNVSTTQPVQEYFSTSS